MAGLAFSTGVSWAIKEAISSCQLCSVSGSVSILTTSILSMKQIYNAIRHEF